MKKTLVSRIAETLTTVLPVLEFVNIVLDIAIQLTALPFV